MILATGAVVKCFVGFFNETFKSKTFSDYMVIRRIEEEIRGLKCMNHVFTIYLYGVFLLEELIFQVVLIIDY